MIYLDYSATTPVDERVLESFDNTCKNFIGNVNSLHQLGIKSKELMDAATTQIANLLHVSEDEIIYTSGSTESNNLAIKGVVNFYKDRGNHIITTKLEHSSVKETINYLEDKGYQVSYVNLLNNGLVDINHLESLINDKTILISINYVDSELGLKQPIEEIGNMLKKYPKVIFHVDATQAVGKIKVDFANIDLVSFSAHKFYGLKGIGCLIKKNDIKLEPLFHGGKSQSIYRSGTPMLPFIVSLAKSLRLCMEDIDSRFNYVLNLNKKIKNHLTKYNDVIINSNDYCIPHILNISILDIKPETFVHALEKHDIYISTKSACSDITKPSESLLALNKSNDIANSSLRISLSYLTKEEEIYQFLAIFDMEYNALKLRNEE